ncbi:Agmatine deiminase [Tolypocladium ophioglossoides CBS 100239]|uniref:Agmatine deiminase n=1 Tax=Tolypocladium ophioglossoides (strain CBS 100239) TaxID=1163406 RepID=A0A0L0NFJ7_TOLOC|nr:Agmatine deiminase [Tolypocladium ophioglossoides CBS 100239]
MAHLRRASLYRPAEWAHHARTILAWPGAKTQYYREVPGSLPLATKDVSAIAEAVARFEPVTLVVQRDRLAEAQKRFAPGSTKNEVRLHPISGDHLDLWMRDIAPTFVLKRDPGSGTGVLHGVDFNFNGWGNKFPTDTCAALARTLLRDTEVERVKSSLVTEGGAIEIDGEGTLAATESSIINDNRNPGQSRQDIEAELRRTLGVEKFIWIPGVVNGEATDCHIDAFVRFARPGAVLLSKPSESEPKDSVWVRAYEEAVDILSSSKDARGRSFEVIEISEPDISALNLDRGFLESLEDSEEQLPAFNYVNYLLVNGGLIFPQFGAEKADAAALETIKQVFGKDREVATVHLKELPLIGGGIHCATQEVPLTEP